MLAICVAIAFSISAIGASHRPTMACLNDQSSLSKSGLVDEHTAD
jgi:hypothetical protein